MRSPHDSERSGRPAPTPGRGGSRREVVVSSEGDLRRVLGRVPPVERSTEAAPAVRIAPGVVPFLVVGTIAVVGGGIAAAVTGPTDWSDGSWVAAYLVLVVGVAQIGLGVGQATLAADAPADRRLVTQLVLVNGGSLAVVVGTLATMPIVVTVGGLVLVAGLITFAVAPRRPDGPQWVRLGYLTILTVLIVSIPIGLALAWVRA